MNTKYLKETLWLTSLFFVLGCIYIYPGAGPLLSRSTTEAMSDGTDPVTLPFMYEQVLRVAKNSPFDLFYGAVPNPVFDAPEGGALWMSWIEKFVALFSFLFFPTEQISTAVVLFILILNGLCFYALSRCLNWPKYLGLALSICWAFNAFTHARAKVHMAMVAIYFLPLVFLGLKLLVQKAGKQGVILAALCFLFASMTLHYFLVLTAVFAPFFLIFYFLQPEARVNLKQSSLRLVVAALPAVLLLLWCLKFPLPSEMMAKRSSALPKTGEAVDEYGIHPFLTAFATRPIDYLAGDTGGGLNDLNPLRALITEHIHEEINKPSPTGFGHGNAHERANSIRWFLLFITGAVIVFLVIPKKRLILEPTSNKYYYFFLAFGIFGFLLSISPIYFDMALGPSAWLYKLVPQIRVSSRSGIFVHFACLMIAGYFLSYWLKTSDLNKGNLSKFKKILTFPLTLPLVAVLSFPAFLNALPVSKIAPPYSSLTDGKDDCGTGLYFPYVSGNHQMLSYYYFIQRLRGTHCSFINTNEGGERNMLMLQSFPLHQQILEALKQNNPQFNEGMKSFVQCTGLQWIVYDPNTPLEWRSQFCSSLGWSMTETDVCQAPRPHKALVKTPEQCITHEGGHDHSGGGHDGHDHSGHGH